MSYTYRNTSEYELNVVGVGIIAPGERFESLQLIENPNIELVNDPAPEAPHMPTPEQPVPEAPAAEAPAVPSAKIETPEVTE